MFSDANLFGKLPNVYVGGQSDAIDMMPLVMPRPLNLFVCPRSRFYHDLKRHLRTGKFRFSDSNSLARLVALASHTDFGFGSNPNRGATHRCYCMEGEWSESLETAVTLQRIRISQYTRQEAINEFLKIIADHPAYGVETHTLDANKNNERIAIELGMRDLYFVNRKGQTERG